MPVQIHGKTYNTVAERLQEAKDAIKSINTEVLPNGGTVVIKATVVTEKGTFTGISSANPLKAIEKENPYEVAETSAVGRALAFAGYGAIENIASADEMVKAGAGTLVQGTDDTSHVCTIHSKQMKERIGMNGKYWDHRWQENEQWKKCSGKPKSTLLEDDNFPPEE